MKIKKIRDISFFAQPADCLAKALIGKAVCRKTEDGTINRFKITETEAYFGDEPFCFGHRVENPQSSDGMFYTVGKICYCRAFLRISCFAENAPDNVLIRGLDGDDRPVLVSERLSVTYRLNQEYLTSSEIIWLEEDGTVAETVAASRKGIPDRRFLNFRLKP